MALVNELCSLLWSLCYFVISPQGGIVAQSFENGKQETWGSFRMTLGAAYYQTTLCLCDFHIA